MTWHWRTISSCDLDSLMDDLNPQMKSLEGNMSDDRPAVMAGYPKARGAITLPLTASHTGDLVETTLKTFDFGRGALKDKSGFRIHAAGTNTGAAGTKTIKLKWGGETLLTASIASGTVNWSIYVELWNRDTTQDQVYTVLQYDGLTLETQAVGTISVDTL